MREQIKNDGIRSQPYPFGGGIPHFFDFSIFKQKERGFFPLLGLVVSLSLIN